MTDYDQNLTPEEKAALIESWIEKYKIERIVVKMPEKVYYLREDS